MPYKNLLYYAFNNLTPCKQSASYFSISTGTAEGEEKYRKLTIVRKYFLSVLETDKVETAIHTKA